MFSEGGKTTVLVVGASYKWKTFFRGGLGRAIAATVAKCMGYHFCCNRGSLSPIVADTILIPYVGGRSIR